MTRKSTTFPRLYRLPIAHFGERQDLLNQVAAINPTVHMRINTIVGKFTLTVSKLTDHS